MEVRIKDNNGYVDADWAIEDGVMIVSPKVEKFEPKDGDIVTNENAVIAIFKKGSLMSFNSYVAYYNDRIWINKCFSKDGISLATEEEKQKLFNKLKEENWEWNADKKELVKLKWKPNIGEVYWCPLESTAHFKPLYSIWRKSALDLDRFELGWSFKTEEECQAFCDRLNEAINSVKP